MKRFLIPLVVCVASLGISGAVQAEDGPAKPPDTRAARIGTYDSRIVAYAYFWTDARQQKLKSLYAEAKAAQDAGDTKRFEELKKALQEGQQQAHRQVFSTAPVDDALKEIKDRLPAIREKAGVSVLVSKWDNEKLKEYASAEKVDVTDLLASEFKPGEKHLKMIESIKKTKPVTLEQADKCD